MAAVVPTSAGSRSMPSRPYSPRIAGPAWPRTSPEAWLETTNALQQKSVDLSASAAAIRRAVDELGSSNSGQTIDAMSERGYRTAQTVTNQSDLYGDMAKAVKESAELIWHAQDRIDEIDRKAHEEIDQLKQQFATAASSLGAGPAAAALYAAAEAIINAAAAEALGAATDTAAAIGEQAAHIGGHPGGAVGSSENPTLQGISQQSGSGTGGTTADGAPTGTSHSTQPFSYGRGEEQPPRAAELEPGVDGSETPAAGDDTASDGPSPNEQSPGGANPATPATTEGTTPKAEPPTADSLEGTLAETPMPMASMTTPAGGGGVSSASTGGGGLKMPGSGGLSGTGSVSPVSSAGGLGPGGVNPTAGLSSMPAGAGLPSAASAGTPTPPSDFSRGFKAGLAGGGSVLPPPVAPPPAQPSSSTAGAYGVASVGGAQSVPAGGGPVAQSAPAASAGGSAPPGGPVGTPMVSPAPAPGGLLPPFNSDIAPRQVSAASASSAPPGTPAAPASSAAGGPGTPLPPGVVAPGSAAAAAGAVAGAKSAAPDPLLADACALVEELMKASRQYGTIDWCVGVFETPAKTLTVVTSGEGAGFIPAGVHLPKGVESLFSDAGLDNAFRRRWFGWINPAQTMVAYAQSVTALDPNIELWAVAVSTGFGGSAQPARAAGVPHYADCPMQTTDTPAGVGAVQPPLDETRLHRLQALNPVSYAQLSSATPVDVRESLEITRQTAYVTFTQASELLTLPIPPLLREIATHLDRGTAITESQWDELASAVLPMAITDSSGQRPGRIGTDTEASSYARVQHNLARLAELLLLWRHGVPDHREVVYLAHHVAAERQLWTGQAHAAGQRGTA
ncbi:chemotaxis protein [Mycobacterium sp. IS-1742]|nr:chemotaxis protein [Mycobacterium sp. IS-1742]